ncbi:MAG: trypsin-like peptidase domain-containing protein [Chloroflexi bacterium]|nr:trypsin-like peptidase domain-containing protein [Chloroflexota bacterium]
MSSKTPLRLKSISSTAPSSALKSLAPTWTAIWPSLTSTTSRSTAFSPVTFGSSDQLVVGQQVLAIGSPFSQRWTMTAGIISALDRAISGFTQFRIGGVIQTDAPINPGNSGGPLLNLNGEVIGVNSQINTTTGSNSGIGFAVPSNLTVRVAGELVASGRVNYSYIGIEGRDLSLTDSQVLNLPNNVRGVVVTSVLGGGPASQAGLRAARALNQLRDDVTTADVITAINGERLIGFDTLISYLAKNTIPGDTVIFTVIRGGQSIQVPVVLASRPR